MTIQAMTTISKEDSGKWQLDVRLVKRHTTDGSRTTANAPEAIAFRSTDEIRGAIAHLREALSTFEALERFASAMDRRARDNRTL